MNLFLEEKIEMIQSREIFKVWYCVRNSSHGELCISHYTIEFKFNYYDGLDILLEEVDIITDILEDRGYLEKATLLRKHTSCVAN